MILTQQVQAALGIVLIAGCTYLGHHFTKQYYQLKISEAERKTALAYAETIAAQVESINKAEEVHIENEKIISDLRNRKPQRVRVPVAATTCADDKAAGSDTGSGALSEGVQRAFDEFETGVGRLIEQCDRLNIDSISDAMR